MSSSMADSSVLPYHWLSLSPCCQLLFFLSRSSYFSLVLPISLNPWRLQRKIDMHHVHGAWTRLAGGQTWVSSSTSSMTEKSNWSYPFIETLTMPSNIYHSPWCNVLSQMSLQQVSSSLLIDPTSSRSQCELLTPHMPAFRPVVLSCSWERKYNQGTRVKASRKGSMVQ